MLQLHISVANLCAVIRQLYLKTKNKKHKQKNQSACSFTEKEKFNTSTSICCLPVCYPKI